MNLKFTGTALNKSMIFCNSPGTHIAGNFAFHFRRNNARTTPNDQIRTTHIVVCVFDVYLCMELFKVIVRMKKVCLEEDVILYKWESKCTYPYGINAIIVFKIKK